MAIGINIRFHRKVRLGWTLEKLEFASGVDRGTISALENRNSNKSDHFAQIAHGLGITLDQLQINPEDWDNQSITLRVDEPKEDEYTPVPQLDMNASCINGKFIEHIVVNGELAFKKEFLKELGVEANFARVFYADNIGMEFTIKQGCAVLINLLDTKPQDQKIFLICDSDGVHYLKRLLRQYSDKSGEMVWVMRSDNLNKIEFPDKLLPIDDKTTIIGRAVWNDNIL